MIIEINYNIKSSDLIYMHNLEGQERNVKKKTPNYAGKKVLQIMEKTVVELILVESSVYHCFF